MQQQQADFSDIAPPSIEDIFSLKKPKDIKAGLSSGLKSVAKGVVGGAVGLIAAPIVGAATDGLQGFAKGVAAGVAGAVLLPATGVTVGLVQVARGVVNQPEAVLESIRGKVWDKEQRVWVAQPESALTTYDAAAATRRQYMGLAGPQLDYYALLEVPRDATPQQIKRQYYVLARKHHPDKNAGDPEAHARFQQLGQAYQVLSNAALRKRYDQSGCAALSDVNFMDSSAFYSALFGSEMFEHLVGELVIATVARCDEDGEGDGLKPADLQQLQEARVDKLAVYLTALLRRYVEGDAEGFKLAMRLEAERLAAASFGATMLHCIGAVYSRQAAIYLGGLLGGTLARVKQGRDSIRSHLSVANAALKVISHQEKMQAYDRQCEERRRQEQQLKQLQQRRQQQIQQIQQQQQQQQQHPMQQAEEEQQVQQHALQQQERDCQLQQPAENCQQVQEGAAASVAAARTPAGAAAAASTAAAQSAAARCDDDDEALDAWDAVWFGNGLASAADSNQQQQRQDQDKPKDSVSAKAPSGDSSCTLHSSGESRSADSGGSQHQSPAAKLTVEGPAPADVPECANSPHTAAFCEDDADDAAAAAAAAVDGDGGEPGGGSTSLEELLQRAELEEASMGLVLEAMWAANVVDIQTTLGRVCRAVLTDDSVSSAVRQLRAEALREIGSIFRAVQGQLQSSQGAKQQMQAAFEAMTAKQMAEQDAAGQA